MQRKKHESWTTADDRQLEELRCDGVPYREIATIMGRTNDACRTRYKILNSKCSYSAPTPPDLTYDQVDVSVTENWTEKELETLFELRRAAVPYSLVSLELKRSIESCRSKFASTDWTLKPYYDESKIAEDMESEVRRAEIHDKILNLSDRRHERHKIGVDALADRFERAIRRLPNIPAPVWTPRQAKQNKEEDVMLLLSDIHIGAEHTFEETGGISEFNRTACYKRLSNLQYAVRDIVELHSKLYSLPRLHIACLGDVVAGDNSSGEWSQNYITMPIVEQVIDGYEKIKNMLAYWLTIFPEITFYGVRGNHGRTGKKGVEKDYSNYDYLCYRFLQAAFADNPRIKFVVPKTWWILTEIRGWKFLLVHGDDVNGGNLPVKKLQDFESKMIGIVKEIPNYTLAGHFHNSAELSTNNGSILLNGSVIGGDIYSIKSVHANSRPEQTIFGINDSRGKTWKYNIDLDDNRSSI